MIRIKSLIKEIHDVQFLHSRDIYNLYYLEFVSSRYPQVVQTPYGQEVVTHYLGNLKQKYLNLFKYLLFRQISKYVNRKRIDPDLDVAMLQPDASATDLQKMMAKTFRSDMKRRNDVWNAVADYTVGLDNANSPAKIFVNINGLNNAIHNTGGKIMFDPSKVSNYRELAVAFDAADRIKSEAQWELLKGKVDKDIRDLLDQEISEGSDGNTVRITRSDRENVEFMTGIKMAVQDKAADKKRDLSGYSDDFVRGYKLVPRDSWWDKVNNKLTSWAVDFGNSYGKR
jgi:hypothetical protein